MIRENANQSDREAVDKSWISNLPELTKIMAIALQLGLLVLIIKLFRIYDEEFLVLSILVFIAFIIHAILPLAYRLIFFTFFSFVSIFMVMGITTGAWIIGLGLVLIGICYLPIPFYARVGMIVLMGVVLASLRAELVSAPWSAGVWPILSSMFMFRLIIYLYDIKHEKRRANFTFTLSYFFMAPNVIFPLFPVVDYKKFQRSYYNEKESYRIYQRGINWIFRGLLHLLLYRFVYQNLTVDSLEVNGLSSVLHFSFSAFLLYLQVSGSFHMIVGILLLFGFNLPETNHLYFLASSFNDFWRRINIYWKDFMMKVFYYPIYFKVRRLGEIKAIVLSTVAVFFMTWFLHAYQWFWLRGTFLIEWHDGLYWGLLAILVIINSLYETKYGRDRSLGTRSRSVLDYAALVLSTAGTFLTLGLLWGMWSSDSLSQWLAMWGTTGSTWISIFILIPSLFGGAWLLGHFAKRKTVTESKVRATEPSPDRYWRTVFFSAILMFAVYVIGHGGVYRYLPIDAAVAVKSVTSSKLNKRDMKQLQLGYYENLISANRHSSMLWNLYTEKPKDWNWDAHSYARRLTDDLRQMELVANLEFTFKNAKVGINKWGFRDKYYEKVKPDNTVRIALLGASHVFGSGVSNEQTFEAVLEDLLNEEAKDSSRYEILNFALSGRTALNHVAILEKMAYPFNPDIVFVVVHKIAAERVVRSLAAAIIADINIPYEGLQSILQRAGVTNNMEHEVLMRHLNVYANELLRWTYTRIVSDCRERNILPVWIFLPHTIDILEEDIREYVEEAKAAGFVTISLSEVYKGYDPKELRIAKWDKHPNVLGHRLIAQNIYQNLKARQSEFFVKKSDIAADQEN